ncbi:nitroreductase family protein [Methylophaga sulfidovorans]|uniref:Nitroreductase n=1 Tax=Methylophaga sulfidovorans TaxID=45496 RepID=A0A1I3Z9K0_9GAMM|nr:nitroreductase family protein [Methylophaga sulfidovorans]SFK40838.1 Nitroreductase [Methylophaga sulfidovorans]
MIQKPADTAQAIEKVMAERWSGRAYDPTVMVTPEEITALCEAARWAPSCFGDEPWRYLVCDKNTDREAWEKLLSALVPGNQEWAKNAPVLILAASAPTFSQNDKPNRWSGYDTGAASISLCLQATSMGLMSHQMGGFDDKKIREAFSIADDIHMWSVIAIGHQAALDNLTEEQLERELSPRQRRPLEQTFFLNNWSEK